MALHLVGETLNKHESHRASETGTLIKLMRGIYVDADDDIDILVLQHAVRISRYLYPKTYLSAGSAFRLGPLTDGRLFIGGRRIQRTRIRALEIIQTLAPDHPSVETASIDDGMGELKVDVASAIQRLLEAFRLRSEAAASINDEMRASLRAQLSEQYGGIDKAADAAWQLARRNGWHREAELAERFLRRTEIGAPVRNESQLSLIVAWHGAPIGNLIHDGFEWRWKRTDETGPLLVRQTTPGRLPPFIGSLLPEGWLEAVLKEPDERAALRSGKRYMSNITIVERAEELPTLPADILTTRLRQFERDGIFIGEYAGPSRSDLETPFEQNLARLYKRSDTPRLSGVQIKAPMFLDVKGLLSPSSEKPFTHILKPAGTGGFEALPVVEWIAMNMGRAVGFPVPDAALIPMPAGMPLALLVERFDIRTDPEDSRRMALEDFCSVMDLPPNAKYSGTIERAARALRPLSTSPDEDLLILFKRALFAWLIADGDMHLKNLAILKISEGPEARFSQIRMAPLYDAVTTRVFPGLEGDHMALKLNGKDSRLRLADFRELASTIGLRLSQADETIDATKVSLERFIDTFAVPDRFVTESVAAVIARMLELVREQLASL